MKFPAPINPGLFRRHKVLIRKAPTRTIGSFGYAEIDWSAATIKGYYWGQLEAMKGRELEASMQRWAEARFVFRTHYVEDVDREDRIEYDGRTFDILDSEDPTGQRRELRVYLRELTT